MPLTEKDIKALRAAVFNAAQGHHNAGGVMPLDESGSVQDSTRQRRRWLRFSLRTFLLVLTALCIWLGVKVNQARRQKEAVEALRSVGAYVHYAHQRSATHPEGFDSRIELDVPRWLRDLAGDDFFQTAVSLRIQRSVTDADLVHLAGLPYIEQLELTHSVDVTDEGLAHLPRPDRLTVFRTYHTSVGDEFVKRLAGAHRLTTLALDGRRVTDEGLRALRGLTQLRRLSLTGTAVSDVGLEAVKEMTSLTSLTLYGTPITDAGLAHLAGHESLEWLNMSKTAVNGSGFRHLTALTHLNQLELEGTEVRGPGLEFVAAYVKDTLVLNDTPINDDGLSYLREAKNLRHLFLEGTAITDDGLRQIARMTNLQFLSLKRTKITDSGLVHLHGLPKLNVVQLEATSVTPQGVAALKAANPWTRIVPANPANE